MMVDAYSWWMLAQAWSNTRFLAIGLGILFAVIALTLVIMSWTRWGQSKPLTNCVILSVLAHVWLLMYAYGTRIVTPGIGHGSGSSTVRAELVSEAIDILSHPEPIENENSDSVAAWEKPTPAEEQHLPPLPIPETLASMKPDLVSNTAKVALSAPPPPSIPPEMIPAIREERTSGQVFPNAMQPMERSLQPANHPAASSIPSMDVLPSDNQVKQQNQPQPVPPTAPEAAPPDNRSVPPTATPGVSRTSMTLASQLLDRSTAPRVQRAMDQQSVPQQYLARMSPARSQLASEMGGDANTEASVENALRWLASVQSQDGRWDAALHGAGKETQTLETYRSGTGNRADTAMTGLALLCFLGAGYTHVNGPYTQVVGKGLNYLAQQQMDSGDLSGSKQIGWDENVKFSKMYSHAMASLAVAEAYAMTGDPRFQAAATKSAQYTLMAQNKRTGGWRYRIGDADPGDLSQFGWQAMLLHSCSSSGIAVPSESWQRMRTFLDSVAIGPKGGLAKYRPVPNQAASTAMTAEALACRIILGMPLAEAAQWEAKSELLNHLPGQGENNLYYCYYATLAMFQLQDRDWPTWNLAMKKHLVSKQIPEGQLLAGSWNPDCIWAGYGGRIYSTAFSCMCLEVYYRYLPLYGRGQIAMNPTGSWR